jgi:RimJ/RimL family protein N-acetyltransferase
MSLEHGVEPPTWHFGDFSLRPLKHNDYLAWSEYLSYPEVTRHTSWDRTDPGSIAELVDRCIADYPSGRSCRWALAGPSDRLIGTCGFSSWSVVQSHAELVYDLTPRFWKCGIASRAVRAVLGWAFGVAAFNRVHAFAMDTNEASIALLSKVGFQREGLLRQYRISHGVPRDFVLYAVLRQDWPASDRTSHPPNRS